MYNMDEVIYTSVALLKLKNKKLNFKKEKYKKTELVADERHKHRGVNPGHS